MNLASLKFHEIGSRHLRLVDFFYRIMLERKNSQFPTVVCSKTFQTERPTNSHRATRLSSLSTSIDTINTAVQCLEKKVPQGPPPHGFGSWCCAACSLLPMPRANRGDRLRVMMYTLYLRY